LIGGLVLAARAATRFGRQKQLALLDGRPLLEHALLAMTASSVGRVVVMLGSSADEIVAEVDLHGAEPMVCARWAEGQSASLACGLATSRASPRTRSGA
jgi:molybdenum cofactor cytidylyltransferase